MGLRYTAAYKVNFALIKRLLYVILSVADMTLFAVLTMAVMSALCIMGMIYLSRKSFVKAKVDTLLSETSEEF